MKRFGKIFVTVLMSLLMVILSAALALWIFLPREKVAAVITTELSNRFKQEITIGSIEVGFYPDLEFVTRNVRILDPPTSREILSAKNLRFDLKLRELLNRKVIVENITVGSARLELVRDIHGAWNVDNLIRSLHSGEKKDQTNQAVDWFEFGRVTIKNGSIRIGDETSGQRLKVNKLAATLDIRDETLTIKSASIALPYLEAELTGTVSQIFKTTPVIKISTTLEVKKEGPLADIQTITVPAGKKIADISLEVSGNVKKARLNTTFSFNPLATGKVPARGSLSGRLQVEEGLFNVDAFKVYLGKSTLSLSGTFSNLWQQERTAHLRGTTGIALKGFVELVRINALPSYDLRGMAEATITLIASAERVGLRTTVNMDNTSFLVPRLIHKKIGMPSRLVLDAEYNFSDEYVVSDFDLLIGNDTIKGNVEVHPESDPQIRALLSTSNFPLKHLNRLPAVSFKNGGLDLSARVWQSREGLRFSGDASIDGATLAITSMNKPFKRLDARINVAHNKATLHAASFFFGESHYLLDAEVTDVSTPRITGHLRTDLLDIDEIIDAFTERKDFSMEATSSRGTPNLDFSLVLQVDADAMHFGRVKTGTVSTTWQTSGRVQQFNPLRLEAFGGTLGGMFELAVLEKGITWRTELSGQDVLIEDLSGQLFDEDERVKGRLTARGECSGRADENPEDVWRSLNGKLSYTATTTLFKESTLFKSMLLATRSSGMLIPGLQQISIANMLIDVFKSRGRTFNINQVYFYAIDGSVTITDGLVHTEDSFFDGDAVDLLFKGDVDLVRDEYTMQIRATPIGTIGSLMGRIPVIGKQIERLRNATLSFNFNLSGPLADPKVQLTAVERLNPKSEIRQGN